MKKNILFFCVIFFLVLIFLSTPLFAVYQGDDTYTDPNNTIKIAYDTIISDLIMRLSTTQRDISNIVSMLKDANYNYYVYYGSSDGTNLINASTWKTDMMWIAFFSSSSPSVSSTLGNYQGIECSIVQSTSLKLFYFNKNVLNESSNNSLVSFPSILLTYKNQNLINFLTNNSTSSIVSAIQESSEQTQNTINQSTSTVVNTVTDSSVDDNSMSVSTENMTITDSQGVENFFSTMFNAFTNFFTTMDYDEVTIISIPLPYVNDVLVLRSDLLSRYIQGTSIYNLIQLFWYFIFGCYFIMFAKRIIDWFSTGKVAEEGVFSFLEWLDIHNEIIKSYMM